MDKLRNKNTVILIISGLLIVIALIVAVSAISGSKKQKAEQSIADSIAESQSIAESLEALVNKEPSTDAVVNKSASNPTGTYKVNTKDDPLGLRLEPNANSDRIIYIPKGHEVKVLAVWENWGYVVYEKTGGWVSMSYLKLVSSDSGTTAKAADSSTNQ